MMAVLSVHPLQGHCAKDSCIYLHKELPASSSVCLAYAAGFCSRGQACTQKHLTPKMLRELRASRTLRAGDDKVRVKVTWIACRFLSFTASVCVAVSSAKHSCNSHTVCKTGMKQVTASKGQTSITRQGLPGAVKATLEHEDCSKKRKWRYFWAEEEAG